MLCQPRRGCVCQNYCCRLPRICGSKIKVKITNPWPKSLSLLFYATFACCSYLFQKTLSILYSLWFSTTVIYKIQYILSGGKWSWPSVLCTLSHKEPPGRSFHTLYSLFVGMALPWEQVSNKSWARENRKIPNWLGSKSNHQFKYFSLKSCAEYLKNESNFI